MVILLFLAYRTIHSSPLVTLEVVANYSLLYHVRGSNSSLTPYLLMGHLDVVRTVNLITITIIIIIIISYIERLKITSYDFKWFIDSW